MPSDGYTYGVVSIYKRSDNSIMILLQGEGADTPLTSNCYNGVSWTGWRTYITNNDLSAYGFPNASTREVTNIYGTKKNGFFYYAQGATGNPVSNRGGVGLCMCVNDNWIVLIVVPYNMLDFYVTMTIGEGWSSWRKLSSTAI